MREWDTAFELYVIAPCGRCTSEAVIYSAAGQAAEVGRLRKFGAGREPTIAYRRRTSAFGQERSLVINSRPSAHEERAALRRSNGDLHQHVLSSFYLDGGARETLDAYALFSPGPRSTLLRIGEARLPQPGLLLPLCKLLACGQHRGPVLHGPAVQ
jgi:hypothetical protein